jgi:hypothetical protein
VITVEWGGAKPGNADEVVAIGGDLEAAQRPQAGREGIEFVVEGVVEYAQQGAVGVEQPDDRVGAFEARRVIQGRGRHRYDIASVQTADSHEVDITTASAEGKHTSVHDRTAARADLN